jgi:ABC-type multidrug transport system permease subunit
MAAIWFRKKATTYSALAFICDVSDPRQDMLAASVLLALVLLLTSVSVVLS